MCASMTGIAAAARAAGLTAAAMAAAAADFSRARLCIDSLYPNAALLLFRVRPHHGYRSQQARRQQRRVGPIRFHVGKCVLGGVRLLVADEPVHPRVDDFHTDL